MNNTAPTQKCAPPSLRERGGDAGRAQGQGVRGFFIAVEKSSEYHSLPSNSVLWPAHGYATPQLLKTSTVLLYNSTF